MKERTAQGEITPTKVDAVSVSPDQVPITIMPLGDFERFGLRVPVDAGKQFVLLTPVVYDIGLSAPVGNSSDDSFLALVVPGHTHLRQVPAGFVTDFASIPWFLRRMLGHPASRFGRAAVLHDWAYSYHHDGSRQGRRDADNAMLQIMRRDGVSPLRRSAIFTGLRIGGGKAYWQAPRLRQNSKPLTERMVFLLLSIQSFTLGYVLRQFEDVGLFSDLNETYPSGEAASGARWTSEISEAIQNAQKRAWGQELF